MDSVSMEEDDRRHQSRANLGSYSVRLEEDDERSPSGSAMGMILLVVVLLAALAALVVGAVKALVWLVHLCGAIHVPIWLANFWDSATAWVIHAWNSMEMPVLLVVGISLALLILLYSGLWVFGFMDFGIALGSCAAMWMSAIGNVVAGSLYSLLQMIAMGGISVFTVLLYIVPCVVLAVGAYEIIVWLVHSGAIHAPTWLVDSWDSATAWVLHAWDSVEIFGWWNSFVAWVHNLWESVTDHHKWKIYT